MKLGDLVIWHGRTYRLLGFDPMSVEPGRAYLEDVETGAEVRAPLDELEPEPPG